MGQMSAPRRNKPSTAKHTGLSVTNPSEFMTKVLISNWTRGDVLDYWTWRRQTGRLEVTSWSTT